MLLLVFWEIEGECEWGREIKMYDKYVLIFKDPINIIFAGVMLFLFIWYRKRHAYSQLLPSILVGIGILGTFTGIFIGLINFNVADIKGSVPQLLEGLKIAFFTSIIGLTLSAWIKVKDAIEKWNFRDYVLNKRKCFYP